jgi:2-polyprenyl-3-methyl-5-hydroxy-6-metoxy-1,4-benzoquinol methylase
MPHLALEPASCCVCASSSGAVALRGRDIEYQTCDNEFQFLACDGCGHLFLSPRPRLEDLHVIYRNYQTNNRSSAYYPSTLVAGIKERIDRMRLRDVLRELHRGSNVLDIGAGAGRLLRLLRSASGGNEVALYANEVHFDPDVREELDRQGITVLEGLIESVTTDLRFDVITSVHVIEHVANPRGMLRWIADHLTKNGVAYLETPDAAAPARTIFGDKWGMTHFPRHFNIFSRRHLAQLARAEGLTVVKHSATTSAPAWNMSIRNTLGFDALTKHRSPLEMFNYSNVATLGAFTLLDLALMTVGLPTSTQQLVLRRAATPVE